jgi:hypothetical protein
MRQTNAAPFRVFSGADGRYRYLTIKPGGLIHGAITTMPGVPTTSVTVCSAPDRAPSE